MTPPNHLSIDIETLGRAPTSAPLCVGWASFDIGERGQVKRKGTIHFDLDSCLAAGLTVDGPTIEWWMRQKPEAVRGLFGPDLTRRSLQAGLTELAAVFASEAGPDGFVWTKGPNFDAAILENAYHRARVLGLYVHHERYLNPWKYNHHRDVRTIMACAGLSDKGRPENSHLAVEDAVAQALLVQEAWAIIQTR